MRAARRPSIVVRCVRGIDSRGLHKTNLEALRTALERVACEDAICLVDGFRRRADFGYEQRAVVGGDSTSAAIAAASVLAKVTRDRYMRRAADRHPGWDFDDERRLLDSRAPGGDRGERGVAAPPAVVRLDRVPAASARPADGGGRPSARAQNAFSRCSSARGAGCASASRRSRRSGTHARAAVTRRRLAASHCPAISPQPVPLSGPDRVERAGGAPPRPRYARLDFGERGLRAARVCGGDVTGAGRGPR